ASLRTRAPLVAAALRDDGRVAATVGGGGLVQLWDVRTRARLRALHPPGGAVAVALDPNGQLVATATGRSALLFDARTGQQVGELVGHTDAVTSVAFSRDSRFLVTASRDHDA